MSENSINLKKILESNDYVIVFDTNIYLNLYRYSPDWASYLLSCIYTVKDQIVVPHTVYMEICKHHRSLNAKRQQSLNTYVDDCQDLIKRQKEKMVNSCCGVLQRGNFPEIDTLIKNIESKYNEVSYLLNNYFDDHSVLSLIKDSWNSDLPFDFIQQLEKGNKVMIPFNMSELYTICEEGEKRYKKQIPPGYKDKDKNGIKQYSDLILWKEIIRYAKESKKNIIFVTDDIKEDWWKQINNRYEFRGELLAEFERDTRNKSMPPQENRLEIIPFIATDFFNLFAENYGIEPPDAIDIAMSLTDDKYIDLISDNVFNKIIVTLENSGEEYLDIQTIDCIGSEGIEGWEIESYKFNNYETPERYGNKVIYVIAYDVELSGHSSDYWGRDEDTKEVILSAGYEHSVGGVIKVKVTRNVDMMMDFDGDNEFEDCEIIEGDLKQISFRDLEYEKEYEDEDAYDQCPRCGQPINLNNDAGNGFCIKCSKESDEI